MVKSSLLAPLLSTAHGMMFRSSAVIAHWDTWSYYDVSSATFFAFMLVTEKSPGEGFVVATSKDGVHWEDRGYVFHKPGSMPPDGTFEHQSCPNSVASDGSPAVCSGWYGTGSVWRTADGKRFVVNFSQCPNDGDTGAGGQNISFATSSDLINWEWVEDDWFSIDSEHYNFPGRWDCIQALAEAGAPQPGPLYGFWTASPKGGGAPWGFGHTDDGLHWTALPAPKLEPPTEGEIGGVEIASFGSPLQTRYYAMIGQYPAMVVYTSDKISGPYVKQEINYNLLSGTSYFSRFARGPKGELLVAHQHETGRNVQERPASNRTPGYPAGRGITYLGFYKEAVVDDEGTMRLIWWSGNEEARGAEIPVTQASDGSLAFATQPDITSGVIVEMQVAEGLTQGDGVVIDLGQGSITVAVGEQETSTLLDATGQVLDVQNRSISAQRSIRVLLRNNQFETYLGDYLGHVWAAGVTADSWPTGAFSVVSSAAAPKVRAWQMSLVGSGLALNGKVTASSELPGFESSLAVDAAPFTRWCSDKTTAEESLTVDLGVAQAVAWMRLEWELAFATAYVLQGSNDGSTWSEVLSADEGEGGVETHRFEPVNYRFFRLLMTAKGLPDQGYSLWDFQLHGPDDVPTCGYWETCGPSTAVVV